MVPEPDPTQQVAFNPRIIAEAEAARDARDWDTAVRLYELAVLHRGGDASLYVQLGHCRKQAGQMSAAEQSYLTARVLRPGDMDIPLQLGHLYSLQGNTTAAIAHYRMAVEGGLADKHAMHYLAIAGEAVGDGSPAFDPAMPVVYFDYSDLIAYFEHSRFPTGIQRIQIELFKASRSWDTPVSLRSCTYRIGACGWVAIDPVALDALCALAAKPGGVADPEWREALADFVTGLTARPELTFLANAILINLGTSWWIDGYMASIRTAKRRSELRYVPLVHDMIPLVAPNYVVPGMTATFAAWIGSVYMHADVVAANSENTGRDVSAHAVLVRPLAHPPVVMPLDADFGLRAAALSTGTENLLLNGFGLVRDDFVLFVGTLEPRKNHHMVFQAWSRLILAHGAAPVPVLVCVGKQGWQFEATRAYLESCPELEDKVLLLSDVSDEELHSLYRCCRFTVYASHYEGWGLPVTESLCHGKVCLTADHSSLPEAGGQFAVYYEDGSLRSFTDKVGRLIFDAAFRREREALISAEYRPRLWSAVLAQLVGDVVARLPASAPSMTPSLAVASGVAYRPVQQPHLARIDRYAAVAEMMRFEDEWHAREDWGAWTRRRQVRLAFATPASLAPHEDLLLYLQVRTATQPVTLSARVDGTQFASVTVPKMARSFVQFRVLAAALPPPGITGVVHLQSASLTPLSEMNASDSRIVGFGLFSVSFAGANDHPARMALVERASALTSV